MAKKPDDETAAVAVPTPAAPVVPPKRVRFVTMNARKFSIQGQIVSLEKGTIIDPAGYGEVGMSRIREAGVILQEVK